jgi:glycosyltransferase involved in cell wall biosynthesis
MAKVFIGIMTYNRPQLVKEAILSVRQQTYTDYQVLVSDNCSEPDTSVAIEQFVQGLQDARFSYYRQSENIGEYGQGWFLFQRADSEFFQILHDDDLLEPDYLAKGLAILEQQPDLAFFVANPLIIDENSEIALGATEHYLKHHGRVGKPEGVFAVETRHMQSGFTPISGTLFRRQALRDSGFANPDGYGNFPFECDIFIRLGAMGAKAWFSPKLLLRFRFHNGALRSKTRLMECRTVVNQMIDLFQRPCFYASNNRRRKVILSRLYRAQALILFKAGYYDNCRTSLVQALNVHWFSPKAWLVAFWVFLLPVPLKWYCQLQSARPLTVRL